MSATGRQVSIGAVGIRPLAVAQFAHLLLFLPGVRGSDPVDGRDIVGLCLLPVRVGPEQTEQRREGGVLTLMEMVCAERRQAFVLEDSRLDPVPDIVAQGMTRRSTPLI